MPRYTIRDTATNEKFQVDLAAPPTPEDVRKLVRQRRSDSVGRAKYEPTGVIGKVGGFVEELGAGLKKQLVGWPGLNFELMRRGSAGLLGQEYTTPQEVQLRTALLDPNISTDQKAEIQRRITALPVSQTYMPSAAELTGLAGPESVTIPPRDFRGVPPWRQKVAGAVDIASGLLGAAMPLFPASYGLRALPAMAGGTAAGALTTRGAEAVGVPEELSEAAGLATGLYAGYKLFPTARPQPVPEPTPPPMGMAPRQLYPGPAPRPWPSDEVVGAVSRPGAPPSYAPIPPEPPQIPQIPPPQISGLLPGEVFKPVPMPPLAPPGPIQLGTPSPTVEVAPGRYALRFTPGSPTTGAATAAPAAEPIIPSVVPPVVTPAPTAAPTALPVRPPITTITTPTPAPIPAPIPTPVRPPIPAFTPTPRAATAAPTEARAPQEIARQAIEAAGKYQRPEPPLGPVAAPEAPAAKLAKQAEYIKWRGTNFYRGNTGWVDKQSDAIFTDEALHGIFDAPDRVIPFREAKPLVEAAAPKTEAPAQVTDIKAGELVLGRQGIYEVSTVSPARVSYKFTGKTGESGYASMRTDDFRTLKRISEEDVPTGELPKVAAPKETLEPMSQQLPDLMRRSNALRNAGDVEGMARVEEEIGNLRKRLKIGKPTAEAKKMVFGSERGSLPWRKKVKEKEGEDEAPYSEAFTVKIANLREKYIRDELKSPEDIRDFDLFRDDVMAYDRAIGPVARLLEGIKAIGSSDKYLDQHPMTKPIVEEAVRADLQGGKWANQVRDVRNAIRGPVLSKAQNDDLIALLNGIDRPTASPETLGKAQKYREMLEDTWNFASSMGAVSSKGEPIRHLDDYLTHIIRRETLPEGLVSAFGRSIEKLFGKEEGQGLIDYLFETSEETPYRSEGGGPGIYRKRGAGEPFVPYAEKRLGTTRRLETDLDKILDEYYRMMRVLIFDKPAIETMNDMLVRLPLQHPARGTAEYFVKNFARQDIFDGGARLFKAVDRGLYNLGASAVLAFSQRLQLLHAARMLGQLAEVGESNMLGGMGRIVENPVRTWEYTKSTGLFGRAAELPRLRTGRIIPITNPSANVRNVMNLMNIGNLVARFQSHQANIYKYKDVLKDPDWEYKAYKDTIRHEGMGGRASPIKFMDNPWFPESFISFKRWCTKLLEQWGYAAEAAIKEPTTANWARVGRYMIYSTLLYEIGKETSLQLFHFGKNVLMISRPGPDILMRTGGYLLDGRPDKAWEEFKKLVPAQKRKEWVDIIHEEPPQGGARSSIPGVGAVPAIP